MVDGASDRTCYLKDGDDANCGNDIATIQNLFDADYSTLADFIHIPEFQLSFKYMTTSQADMFILA